MKPGSQTPITPRVKKTSKQPWPIIGLIVASLIFGPAVGFLLVWQNLRRLNKKKPSTKLLIAGLFYLGVTLILALLASFTGSVIIEEILGLLVLVHPFWMYFVKPIFASRIVLSLGFSLFLPVWFHYYVMKKSNKPKTRLFWSWSIIPWCILGVLLYLFILTFHIAIKPMLLLAQ